MMTKDLDAYDVERDAEWQRIQEQAHEEKYLAEPEHDDVCQCGCNEPIDAAYEAYIADMIAREQRGEPWPIGELMPCYQCKPATDVDKDGWPCVMRRCVAIGAVVNKADPTQSYDLECGHGAI